MSLAPLTGSLLLRPLIDAPVAVDPGARTARVPAGKTWGDVLPELTRHGLTAASTAGASASPRTRYGPWPSC